MACEFHLNEDVIKKRNEVLSKGRAVSLFQRVKEEASRASRLFLETPGCLGMPIATWQRKVVATQPRYQ